MWVIRQSARLYYQHCLQTSVSTLLVSINPYKKLSLYTPDVIDKYRNHCLHQIPPHMWVVTRLSLSIIEAISLCQLLPSRPGVASAEGSGWGPGHRPHGGERRREDRGGEAGDAVHRRRHRPHQGVPGHQVPAPPVKPSPRRWRQTWPMQWSNFHFLCTSLNLPLENPAFVLQVIP